MKPCPKGWPRISACVFYPDASAAIDWLCKAFGFEVRLRVDGEAGRVVHSELEYLGGLIGATDAGNADKPDHAGTAPETIGGGNTQNLFAYVDDIEAHCARARAAGAQIVIEPKVSDYGDEYWSDKSYGCVDVGGHHWWFAQRLSTGASYVPKLDGSRFGDHPPPKGWPRISSTLYYQNANRAIDWLCEAFGFEVQLKVEGEAGRIEHSELIYGDGLMMVGDEARERAEGYPRSRCPASIGGANTQVLMMYVDDVDAMCARARKAGARVITEPSDSDYGAEYWTDRNAAILDIGGHRWWFAQRLRG